MQHKLNSLIILILGVFLAACGVTERLPQATMPAAPEDDTNLPREATHASTYSQIQSTLRKAYRKWQGTPYRWGGTTINGVDCSAFMQILFNHYFGVEIPRTTDQQIYAGTEVNRRHLKPGDLIFLRRDVKRYT